MNPSSSFSSVSFLEITRPLTRRYAQEYMKYQMGITGQAVSTIVIKYGGIRNFLTWLCERGQDVSDCGPDLMDKYIKELQEQDISAKTALMGFWNVLVLTCRMFIMSTPFSLDRQLRCKVR